MCKKFLRVWVLAMGLIAGFYIAPSFAEDESFTITTYYPSPYGVYKELRLYPNTSPNTCDATNEGAMYYDDSPTVKQVKVCRKTGTFPDTYDWRLLGGGCPDVPGADQSNCWEDIDGDGYSARTGDCDETCATCYKGATFSPASPDSKDQNCNGIIDEVGIGYERTCSSNFTIMRLHVETPCSAYCASIGRSYYGTNCTNPGTAESVQYTIDSFSTCGFRLAYPGGTTVPSCFYSLDSNGDPIVQTFNYKCYCGGYP